MRFETAFRNFLTTASRLDTLEQRMISLATITLLRKNMNSKNIALFVDTFVIINHNGIPPSRSGGHGLGDVVPLALEQPGRRIFGFT